MSIVQGHYARKQLASRSAIIRWTHGARFRKAVKLAGGTASDKLLDYGCGDGTFIGFVAGTFGACVGADIAPEQIDDCRARFQGIPNVSFCLVRDLALAEHARAYGVVTCMETLEHCTEESVQSVLADLNRLCASPGTVVISVPIETGPVFLIKYLVRKMAAWRGMSEYARYETYSMRDARRMLFATERTLVDRPAYGRSESRYHSHYGFNWRRLRGNIGRVLDVQKTQFSPIGLSGGWLSSQVWFVCRPRH